MFAVTAASFIGFTGFTLVMPFLPLFIRELGVNDLGEIALWTGAILAVTPALTALLAPFWGRLADRFGRKLMVARSLIACAVVMGAMAFVTHPWQVFALRALLGLLTGYGGLTLSMAAESAPPGRMAAAIGTVQTAQRLGPAIGPVIGGVLAGVVGLRQTFLVTSALYGAALALVLTVYDERAAHVQPAAASTARVGVRTVLRLDNFVLLMGVMFAIQFVDRSFGPILPLYLEQLGTPHDRVAPAAGLLFSVAALSGATGHHFCGRLLQRHSPMTVIAGAAALTAGGASLMALAAQLNPAGAAWTLALALSIFGLAIGTASTATYTAAGSIIPGGSHATGFGLMSSASLSGLAISPIVSGVLADVSMRGIFALDVAIMIVVGLVASRTMRPAVS